MTEIKDITVAFRTDLPLWPGDPAPNMTLMKSQECGYRCNVTRLDTGVHFGTHLDAPCHFIEGGKPVEELDLDLLVGPCVVGEVPGVMEIMPGHLEALNIPDGTKRLLLKTDNSALWDTPNHPFHEDFTALTADAAQWVVDRGIGLIGIDYLSIQLFADAVSTTHLLLLGAEVIIVEGLDLREIAPGSYNLTCLPMKIAGADGAPVRAILTTM
ncbi:MAG: cyclase family protein [Alphaproteobacteria bacterium]|nr:cyclase family protein [Alphaproteobacteria bacterium]